MNHVRTIITYFNHEQQTILHVCGTIYLCTNVHCTNKNSKCYKFNKKNSRKIQTDPENLLPQMVTILYLFASTMGHCIQGNHKIAIGCMYVFFFYQKNIHIYVRSIIISERACKTGTDG